MNGNNTSETSEHFGASPTTTSFDFGKPEDHFRRSSNGLEMYDEDFFLDISNNVWARTPHGYRRIHGMTFTDLCARSRDIARRKEEAKKDEEKKTTESTELVCIEENPQKIIEIPALVLPKREPIAVNDPEQFTNEEVEEALEKMASHGYDENLYTEALVESWKRKTSDEIAELIITNPEEACIVLEKALNIHV
jgi:hypothetical protein